MIPLLILAAVVFACCFAVDKGFQKLFRGRPEHQSGLAVKHKKRAAVFGLILTVLGIAGILTAIGSDWGLVIMSAIGSDWGLVIMSAIVLLMGIALIVYYLSFGIYYDEETFLVSSLGKKTKARRYEDIREQKLYVIQGGSALVELHMADGSTVSVQNTMEGASAFLDYAFARWCEQKGLDSDDCDFHDPSSLQWFPAVEEQ